MASLYPKIQRFLAGGNMAKVVPLQGRHFLVTGCAEGSLGFATALQLLEQGAVVTVTTRSNSQAIAKALQQQLAQNLQQNVHAFDVDLANFASVEAFIKAYQQTGLQLDVLINNAGIHLDLLSQWQSPKLSTDGHEIHWRVNYLGTAHLTYRILPLLKASAAKTQDSRIVNVISQLHSKGQNQEFFNPTRPYNSWNAYGQSKLGILHLTKSLQTRFSENGITSYCLHPGAVYTNVADKGLAGTGWVVAIRNALASIEKLFLKTPKQGAQTSIHCAIAPLSELQGAGYYRNVQLAKESQEAKDCKTQQQLWHNLEAWLQAQANTPTP